MTSFPFPSDQVFHTSVFPQGLSFCITTLAPVLDLSSEVPSLDTTAAWPAVRGLEGMFPLACRLCFSSQVPTHWLSHTNGILLNSGHLAIRVSSHILF